MFRLKTNTTVMWQSAGGVSLILPDVRLVFQYWVTIGCVQKFQFTGEILLNCGILYLCAKSHKCDLIYRNRSKSHIGSYEMIDFKDFDTL